MASITGMTSLVPKFGKPFQSWLNAKYPGAIMWHGQDLTGTVMRAVYNGVLDSDYDGTYSGTTLGQPFGGNIPYAGSYITNDYADIYSTALDSVFDGDEGSLGIFATVNSGVWTDGESRYAAILRVDANNWIAIPRLGVNNQITGLYQAGGTQHQIHATGQTTLDPAFYMITWSKSAGATGEVKFFMNGVQQGVTATGLGIWSGGALSSTECTFGARNTSPTQTWSGKEAEGLLFLRAIAPSEVAEIYNRSGI